MFAAIISFATSSVGKWVIIGLVISAAVGYHFYVVSSKDNQIIILQNENTGLRLDNVSLKTSNASLETNIKQRDEINAQMLQELTNIRNADAHLQKELDDKRARLLESERAKKLDNLRNSKNADTLLDFINKNAQCQTLHFGEDGICRLGIWHPTFPTPSVKPLKN